MSDMRTANEIAIEQIEKKLVDAKRTTWDKLVELGLALDPEGDKFMAAFEQASKPKRSD